MNTCQFCGKETTEQMFEVLPWGATCAPCVDEIKEAKLKTETKKAIYAIKVSIDATNPEEIDLIADLQKAIELLERNN